MSWLKRLLGRDDDAESPAAPPGGTRIALPRHDRGVVSVPEIDFVGERAASPNGRYTLLWHDRRWAGEIVSAGRFVLVDGETVVVEGRMERPQDGKVVDSGIFILNDWGASDALCGTFHAFRPDGSIILSRPYSANLLNNGLSRDGRLAACQTCNAPGSPDSSILTLFDLEGGDELARWTPESEWANGYEFPEGEARIRMVRHDRPSLDYSLEGEFLDRKLWLQDETARGTLHVIRKALAEGAAASGLSTEGLRIGARHAIDQGDERFRAEGWRLLGEVEESADEPAAALDAYEQALALNPKIGVAKRAAALRKASTA
jgi:hypothetical protein